LPARRHYRIFSRHTLLHEFLGEQIQMLSDLVVEIIVMPVFAQETPQFCAETAQPGLST
jgi:hypothetical protein